MLQIHVLISTAPGSMQVLHLDTLVQAGAIPVCVRQTVPRRTEEQGKQQEKWVPPRSPKSPTLLRHLLRLQTLRKNKHAAKPLVRNSAGILRGLNRAEGMGKRWISKASQLDSNCWHPASLEMQGREGNQGASAPSPADQNHQGCKESLHPALLLVL